MSKKNNHKSNQDKFNQNIMHSACSYFRRRQDQMSVSVFWDDTITKEDEELCVWLASNYFNPQFSATAVFFLGKTKKRKYVKLYRKLLRQHLFACDNVMIYPLLIALEDAGEKIRKPNSLISSLDHDKNLKVASSYLKRNSIK